MDAPIRDGAEGFGPPHFLERSAKMPKFLHANTFSPASEKTGLA